MLLTNVLFASMAEVNSTLKLRFAVPGMMTSSLPKFGNSAAPEPGQSHWGCE